MTSEQHGSKTERIAELKRERTKLKEREVSRMSKGGRVALVNRLDYIDRELRNEGEDSKTEEGRDGWQLVPVEPTIEMLRALYKQLSSVILEPTARNLYANMLAAAPSPLASVEAGRGEREALAAFIEWADSPQPSDCPYCYVPESWEPTTEHLPECPFVKARAALSAKGTTTADGGRDE